MIWGALHGLYLVIQQLWARWVCSTGQPGDGAKHAAGSLATRFVSWALTMLAVVLAWVLFRATSLDGAGTMYAAMLTFDAAETSGVLWNAGIKANTGWLLLGLLSVVALWPRNSNALGQDLRRWIERSEERTAFAAGAAGVLICLLILLNNTRGAAGAFIYFNF